MLPKQNRLNLAKFFPIFKKYAYAQKTPLFTLLWKTKVDYEYPRIGFVVSNKIGKAVVRNRIRRILREVVSESLADLPPKLDLILIANFKTGQANFEQLKTMYTPTLERICSKIKQ